MSTSPAETAEPVEPERDHWQEYKDDLAIGRIWPDGTQRDLEPEEQ